MSHISNLQRWWPVLCLLLLCSIATQAQGIRRSVIGSTGSSALVGATGYRLRSTVAQPPNAGTIANNTNYLRQGFQQPTTCASAPQALMEALALSPDNCGSLYVFNYLDQPDPNTEFFWTFGLGAQPQASYEVAPGEVGYLAPGVKMIILEVLTEDCRSTDTLLLDVPVIPMTVVPNVSDLWCREEEDGGIGLYLSGGTEPYSVAWSNGDTGIDIGGLSPGAYAYTITDANGCLRNGEATVSSPDSLRATEQIRDESCLGSLNGSIALEITGGTAPYAFQWSEGSSDAVAGNLAKGSYSVTISDEHDCRQYLEFEVGRLCEGLMFYDVFTPNGDGKNDRWIIEGIEQFPASRLSIYDRWGGLIYTAQGYANDWEGRRNDDSELPLGAYFYLLHLGDPADTVLKGSVTIIR
jgi:gliding motility-associated-like protein